MLSVECSHQFAYFSDADPIMCCPVNKSRIEVGLWTLDENEVATAEY